MSRTFDRQASKQANGRALPVTAPVLQNEIRRHLARYRRHPERVLLIRASESGNGFVPFEVDGRTVRVTSGASPLAVLDAVTSHLEDSGAGEEILVVLTDAEEARLGPGLLGRVLRQRVFPVEPWRVIAESFGVRQLDPRLAADPWTGRALLEAMPPGRWARLSGTTLSRDDALRALTVRRLQFDQLGLEPADLDAGALLLWSLRPDLVAAFKELRRAEQDGLIGWLRETVGGVIDPLFALVEAGNAGDALPLGLACAALWHCDSDAERARGAALAYITMGWPGSTDVGDDAVRHLAEAAEEQLRSLLDSLDRRGEVHEILAQADRLLARFGGGGAARHSCFLPSGLEARIEAAGDALDVALRDQEKTSELAGAVSAVRGHARVGVPDGRIRRLEMAQRLVQWLALGRDVSTQAVGVRIAVETHVDQWAWVDRANADVWEGEEKNRTLQKAYRSLYQRVRNRRLPADRAFAARLTSWDGATGETLGVESVVEQVFAPLVAQVRPAPLILLLDGMSTAVATELAADLRSGRWTAQWAEYDPVARGEPRRRGVVAALPTLTEVSRTSLFTGRITTGDLDQERSGFERHRAWRGRRARLFHRSALAGAPGGMLGDELTETLTDEATTVAVVLNAVDDSLDRGRADVPWQVEDVIGLRTLLDLAASEGRPVLLTSDHGHVLSHSGTLRTGLEALSARHRAGGGPIADGEVELVGPRIVAQEGSRPSVALWDPDARYSAARAGYHGGASLAEVVVPLLAFLPFGAEPPKGWRALPDQEPPWWSLSQKAGPPTSLAVPSQGPHRRQRKERVPEQDGLVLFPEPDREGEQDVVVALAETTSESRGDAALVTDLMASELFRVQLKLIPRKVATGKLERVLLALLESGALPLPVLAEVAGEPVVRARGFAATLQRILNVENYPVLGIIDSGRTVTLDRALLMVQFELRGR